VIPFAKFEPDRTKYALDVSTNAVNCLPVADGWGPQPDLVGISDALASMCRGAVYVRTSTGTFRLIAGTATKLYELNTTDYSWTDITRLAGGDYAVPTGDRWTFTIFGQNLIAHNLADDIQFIGIDGGTEFAALSGSPPKAKYSWVAGEHLVLGHLATDPNRIMTSGIGDATYWTVGQRGCDFQSFPDGEEVVGGIGSERGALVFQRTVIRQMVLTSGGDFSFTTSVVNPARGVVAGGSIASIGPGQFFAYSADGFFLGVEGRPIGAERVDAFFQSRIEGTKIKEIRSVADPYRKIVWTQAEQPDGTKFLLGYNWQLDRWCYSDANVSEMCVMVTPGMSWDGLADIWATIDEVEPAYDSGQFTGGLPRFAAFNSSNELGFFTGTPRAATLDTYDDETNPGYRTLVDAVRLYGDVTDFTLRAITSNIHGDTRTVGSAKSPETRSGLCHMRSDARIHAFRLEIPAETTWNHVIGVQPENPVRTGRV
jgi:hypothetical protein